MAACGIFRQAVLVPSGAGRQASAPAPAVPPARRAALLPLPPRERAPACCALQREPVTAAAQPQQQVDGGCSGTSRRGALALGLAAAAASLVGPATPSAEAIQGLTAGRVPGRSKEADADGYYTYVRPDGKSGGHGVGWSEIPKYSFKVPDGWDETPVSIADLGGTEIDLRYTSKEAGEIAVVVAPVLRFMDVGYNASVTLKDVGPPERVIAGFAPELFGKPLDEEDVLNTQVKTQDNGQLYYFYELKPRRLVAMTAVRNRVFIITVAANSRQWKKHEDSLRVIQQSFKVPMA